MDLRRVVFVTAALLLIFSACSSRLPRPGEERVVEASQREPDWVKAEEPSFEDEGTLFFRGQTMGARDLALGLRQAEADAKKRLISHIAEQAATEYSEQVLGDNLADGENSVFLADGISWASERVTLSGAGPAKSYWEKVATGRGHGVLYTYNAHVLLAIPQGDYEQARRRALRVIDQRVRAQRDREVEEQARRLRERLGWE